MGLLTRLIRAATPNNPSFNLNDPRAWDEYFYGEPASSGARITRQASLGFAPWWRGVNLLSRDVGRCSLVTYNRVESGKERATEHPAFMMLLRKPNPFQTALQFKMQLTGHALTGPHGSGYAYIERLGDGITPAALWPLDPEATRPERVMTNGKAVLQYITNANNQERVIDGADVLHIRGFGFDGIAGYNVIEKAREELGLGIARRNFSAKFFRNDASQGVVLTTDQPLKQETREELQRSWDAKRAGVSGAFRTAMLSHGLKAQTISYSARESQLDKMNEMSAVDVANFLGIPPHKLGVLTGRSYASLEQDNLAYLTEGLDFWLCNWEEECWDKLLTEQEKADDSVIIEFRRKDLVQADLTALANYYRAALGGRPWMVPNEARNDQNLNALDGWDEPLDPLNMGQGGVANEPAPEPMKPTEQPADKTDQGEDAMTAAIKAQLADVTSRMAKRIGKDAEHAAKEPKKFLAWIEGCEGEHGKVVAEVFAAPCRIAHEKSVIDGGWSARDFFSIVRTVFTECYDNATPANFQAAISAAVARLESLATEGIVQAYFGKEQR